MSIDRINISNAGVERSQGTQANELPRTNARDRQTAPGSDSVAFSSRANELNRLAISIEQSRAEHLMRVRADIEAETYHVSAEQIAQALLDANMKGAR
jgi:anti-sigma28 factor (negative regulator of flagellin synthesis)